MKGERYGRCEIERAKCNDISSESFDQAVTLSCTENHAKGESGFDRDDRTTLSYRLNRLSAPSQPISVEHSSPRPINPFEALSPLMSVCSIVSPPSL